MLINNLSKTEIQAVPPVNNRRQEINSESTNKNSNPTFNRVCRRLERPLKALPLQQTGCIESLIGNAKSFGVRACSVALWATTFLSQFAAGNSQETTDKYPQHSYSNNSDYQVDHGNRDFTAVFVMGTAVTISSLAVLCCYLPHCIGIQNAALDKELTSTGSNQDPPSYSEAVNMPTPQEFQPPPEYNKNWTQIQ